MQKKCEKQERKKKFMWYNFSFSFPLKRKVQKQNKKMNNFPPGINFVVFFRCKLTGHNKVCVIKLPACFSTSTK